MSDDRRSSMTFLRPDLAPWALLVPLIAALWMAHRRLRDAFRRRLTHRPPFRLALTARDSRTRRGGAGRRSTGRGGPRPGAGPPPGLRDTPLPGIRTPGSHRHAGPIGVDEGARHPAVPRLARDARNPQLRAAEAGRHRSHRARRLRRLGDRPLVPDRGCRQRAVLLRLDRRRSDAALRHEHRRRAEERDGSGAEGRPSDAEALPPRLRRRGLRHRAPACRSSPRARRVTT